MTLLPLLLCAVPQAADHASLHPADVDLWFAVPDVAAANLVYGEAPLARILADPDLGEFARDAMGLDALDLKLSPIEALALLPAALGLGVPVDELVSALLPELRAVSISLSGLGPVDPTRVAEIERIERAADSLQNLEAHLTRWSQEHEGRSPESLALLPATDGELSDPWGRAFLYEQRAGGTSWRLVCLGRDGELGGRFADADFEKRWDVGAINTGVALEPLSLQVVLEFASEAAAIELADELGALPLLEHHPTETPNALLFGLDDLPHHRAWSLRSGARLSLGVAAEGAEALHAQYLREQGAEGLAQRAQFVSASAALDAVGESGDPGTTVLEAWQTLSWMQLAANALQLGSTIDGEGQEGELQAILAFLHALTGDARVPERWRTRLAGGEFHTRSQRVHSGAAEGLDAWLGASPLALEGLPGVPSDAMLVWATTLDADALADSSLTLMEQVSGIPSATWVRSIQDQHGFHLRDDLFGQLGESVLLHSQPLAGVGPPKLYATVELDDPEAFWGAFESFGSFLGQELAGELAISGRPYRGVPILTLDPGISSMLQPSFCVLEGRLVAALTATHLKREIKRIDRGEELEMRAVASLLANPSAAQGATSLYYMDWGVLVEGVYGLAQSFGPMLSGMADLPVDLGSLPPADGIVGSIGASLSLTTAGALGSRTSSTSSWGPEMPLVLASAAGLAFFSTSESSPPVVIAELPETAQAALSEATQESLRALRGGIGVYRAVNGGLPGALAELVAASESWPNGYLSTTSLPVDGWGNPFRFAVVDSGDAYRLWSAGPDGVDQGGEGDDVLAP